MKFISFAFIAFLAFVALAAKSCKYPEFKNKVVLVTGGSSGIGYQTALMFARCGAQTVIVARDSHPTWFNGSTAESKINKDKDVVAAGGHARFVKADMSKKADVKKVMDSILENEKDLHIAINNAAITGPVSTLDNDVEYLQGEYDSFQMNTYAVMRSTIGEVRVWKQLNHSGIIINTASDDGLRGGAKLSLYAGSKSAIIGFTRSTAMRYITGGAGVPKIRVNAVAPGLINTSFTWQQLKIYQGQNPWEGEYITPDSELWQRLGPAWINMLPGKRIGEPSEISDVMMFLASDKAKHITGNAVSADFATLSYKITAR